MDQSPQNIPFCGLHYTLSDFNFVSLLLHPQIQSNIYIIYNLAPIFCKYLRKTQRSMLSEPIVPIDNTYNWKRQVFDTLYAIWCRGNRTGSQSDLGQQIEIELKYACRDPDNPNFTLPEQMLRTVSRQAAVLLRESSLLQNRFYYSKIKAGFGHGSQKFYSIKEYLDKISDANNSRKWENPNCKDVFAREAQRSKNTGVLFKQNTLRLDVNISDKSLGDASKARYTYTHGVGWEKLLKNQITIGDPNNPILVAPVDLVYSEKQFRLTFNSETLDLSGVPLAQLRPFLQGKNASSANFRLKNIVKYQKNEVIEFSLSEVLTINSPDIVKQILENMDYNSAMDRFLVNQFANFYVSDPNNVKSYEIESEVTQTGVQRIKEYVEKRRLNQFNVFMDEMLHDIASLSWADYRISQHDMDLMYDKYKKKNKTKPKALLRLNHTIGNYMHTELQDFMKQGE